MNDGSDNDGDDQDGQNIRSQRVIKEMISHGAVGDERDHVIEAEKRLSAQRGQRHDPKAKVSDQRNVVPNACSHEFLSTASRIARVVLGTVGSYVHTL